MCAGGDRWVVFPGPLVLFQKGRSACCGVCCVPEVRFSSFFLFQETNNNYICFLSPICFQQGRKKSLHYDSVRWLVQLSEGNPVDLNVTDR